MSHLELVALVVRDYDAAIRFFVDVLQFELVEDTPSLTNDGRPKRWVVIRPDGGQTGILLARADGDQQTRVVGEQFAGRVGMFLRVDDFDSAYQRIPPDIGHIDDEADRSVAREALCPRTSRGAQNRARA
jgi:catechol 2,3-dioxygenase-like lactoylglutathione lyase family enzyme